MRVVVVEDSLVQRAHLVSVLEADRDIKVVGEASTVSEALDSIARNRPDVITVDLHIPEGGGHLLIEQIMARTPTPILVLSATVRNDQVGIGHRGPRGRRPGGAAQAGPLDRGRHRHAATDRPQPQSRAR